MKYVLGTILVLILFTLFSGKKSHMTKLKNGDTVLAMGDSLTYGFGTPPEKSYPAVLQQLSGHRVINAGRNGDTSAEGMKRLPALLDDPTVKVMILCFGGNDILQKKSMKQLKTNLKHMIQMAKAKSIGVLLIAVPDFSLFGLSPLPLYEEVSEEEEVPLVSGLLSEILGNPSLKSDQIHPNAKGYNIMAEKIVEALQQYGWI